MRKILKSLFVVAVVAGAVVLGARAYFSDTETSTRNVLEAGSIDLMIDNHSWYYGPEGLVEREDLSWELKDLTVERFFDFYDLKPGDWGEDTISVHVSSNPAWVCADVKLTESSENGLLDPEKEAGDTTWGKWGGELGDELSFVFWLDDGDNVWECEDMELARSCMEDSERCHEEPECEEPLMSGKVSELGDGMSFALADSQHKLVADGPLDPKETYYIGKFWCYGEIGMTYLPDADRSPDEEDGPGFTCDGEMVGNISQTDRLKGDISFYAVQARHNMDFVCEKPVVNECTGWDCLEGLGGKDFFVTGRADKTNWDMAIWDGSPEVIGAQGEYPWVNGADPVPFSLSYDPVTGQVNFDVSGTDLYWTYEMNKAFDYIVVMAKGNAGGDMTLTNVVVDGVNVGTVQSVGNYVGAQIPLTDAQQGDGFLVTGLAEMDWEEKTTQEIPGMHVFAMGTHDLD